MIEKLYQQRPLLALGQHYTQHLVAMTSEGLDRKSDIAAELAHRDKEIDRWKNQAESLQKCSTFKKEYDPKWQKAYQELKKKLDELQAKPINLVIHCPNCTRQHVDYGHWAIKKHRTHKCSSCNHEWKPCERYSFGVTVP